MRKLPFNNGEGTLEAAEKFLVREGLGRNYSQEIQNFLKANALNYRTRDPSKQSASSSGPGAPGGSMSAPKQLPMVITVVMII